MTRTRYFPKLENFSSAVILLHQLNPDTAISRLININVTPIRHGIYQKFYPVGFSGKKFYTVNFT